MEHEKALSDLTSEEKAKREELELKLKESEQCHSALMAEVKEKLEDKIKEALELIEVVKNTNDKLA